MTVTELYDGRTQTVGEQSPRAVIPYLVDGVADEAAAITAAEAAIDTYKTIGGHRLKLQDIVYEMLVDGATWRAEARYEKSDLTDEGDNAKASFTTLGGTEHVTQSLETRAKYGPQAADHKGSIGFDGENVKGMDILTGTLEFTWLQHKTDAEMTPAYLGTLYRLSPSVNDDDVNTPRGNFNAGELLFVGVSASQRADGDWDLTFQFVASPNRANFDIGDITVTEKKGHDYMWFEWAEEVDDAAGAGGDQKVRVKVPIAVYVERVYEESDFSDLDLDGWT